MIQIDMNKPTNCDNCPFCFAYDCIIHERVTHEYYDGSQEQYWHCPLIEPERKKGEWIDTGATPFTNNEGQLIHEKMCSKCASIAYFRSVCGIMIANNVCPNCGSDMRGGENG